MDWQSNPIDRQFELPDRPKNRTCEIVGVVRDAHYSDLREPPPPMIYRPLVNPGRQTLLVRSSLDPLSLAQVIRNAAAEVHPAIQVRKIESQSTLINNTLLRERLLANLGAAFGILGLTLVAIGLYGLLNYTVLRRTREIGVRLRSAPLRPASPAPCSGTWGCSLQRALLWEA